MKMKILFVYPNSEGYGRIPLGPSVILTILKNEGHDIKVFDPTFLKTTKNLDSERREKAGVVIPTDTSYLYDQRSDDQIDDLLRNILKKFEPQLIISSIVEDNYEYADHLFSIAKSVSNVPLLVGGTTPSLVPEIIIENPNIDYIIQGEGEEAIKEFCELMSRRSPFINVRNLWYKDNGQVKHNPIRPFVDMDTLPVQDLSLWNKSHFIKPYNGKVYKAGYYEISRGCPNNCSYCFNALFRKAYSQYPKYFREKSIKNVIKEIRTNKVKYGLEMIFFGDDNFLLMNIERFKDFCNQWNSEIRLPYWINTEPYSITKEKLRLLKDTNCAGIGLGIESGSEWMRDNILLRPRISNQRLVDIFSLIHEFDIRTGTNNIIGFPGETEEDFFETVKLNIRIKPRSYAITFLAPYAGTSIHYISRKYNYIDTYDKPGFIGMAKGISMRAHSGIRSELMTSERINELHYTFMDYVNGKIPIPDKYKNPVFVRPEISFKIAQSIKEYQKSLMIAKTE
ncbi:MAG: radical SAM protein [archaeon]